MDHPLLTSHQGRKGQGKVENSSIFKMMIDDDFFLGGGGKGVSMASFFRAFPAYRNKSA